MGYLYETLKSRILKELEATKDAEFEGCMADWSEGEEEAYMQSMQSPRAQQNKWDEGVNTKEDELNHAILLVNSLKPKVNALYKLAEQVADFHGVEFEPETEEAEDVEEACTPGGPVPPGYERDSYGRTTPIKEYVKVQDPTNDKNIAWIEKEYTTQREVVTPATISGLDNRKILGLHTQRNQSEAQSLAPEVRGIEPGETTLHRPEQKTEV